MKLCLLESVYSLLLPCGLLLRLVLRQRQLLLQPEDDRLGRLVLLLLLATMYQGQCLSLGAFLLEEIESLLEHLYLVLQVADLIALSVDLAHLEFELGRFLLFLRELKFQGADLLELALDQLYGLGLRCVIVLIIRVPDRR